MFGIENDEFEISCPNSNCYTKIQTSYSTAFNYGEMNCPACGTQVKLNYTSKDKLRNAVLEYDRAKSDYDRAQENLNSAIDNLLVGADMTTKI